MLTPGEVEGMIQDTGGRRIRRGSWDSWAHDRREEALVLAGGYETGIRDVHRRLVLSAEIADEGGLEDGVQVEVERRDGSWEPLLLVDPEVISDGELVRFGVRPAPPPVPTPTPTEED